MGGSLGVFKSLYLPWSALYQSKTEQSARKVRLNHQNLRKRQSLLNRYGRCDRYKGSADSL